MGNPLSNTLSEIFLNHFENNYVFGQNNKFKGNIIYWYRYVDDIIILFNGTHRQLGSLHNFLNNIHQKLKFTIEIENDNKQLNFLDLTITRDLNNHIFNIFRKPTQTNHTINNTSNHPFQHKIAAYQHLICRLNLIPLSPHNYETELKTIKHIAHINGYSNKIIDQLNTKHKEKHQQRTLSTLFEQNANIDRIKQRYIIIDYNKTYCKIIQQPLKQEGYIIAYRTDNKMQQKINMHNNNSNNETGVYKLTCNDCDRYYIGQTGRSFEKRFNEHIKEKGKTNIKSNFAAHLTEEDHTYTDINTNMQILHRLRKGQMMDRLEEIAIYKNKSDEKILNDRMRGNEIYDIILSK